MQAAQHAANALRRTFCSEPPRKGGVDTKAADMPPMELLMFIQLAIAGWENFHPKNRPKHSRSGQKGAKGMQMTPSFLLVCLSACHALEYICPSEPMDSEDLRSLAQASVTLFGMEGVATLISASLWERHQCYICSA